MYKSDTGGNVQNRSVPHERALFGFGFEGYAVKFNMFLYVIFSENQRALTTVRAPEVRSGGPVLLPVAVVGTFFPRYP